MRNFVYRVRSDGRIVETLFSEESVKKHTDTGLYHYISFELFELVPRTIETKTVIIKEIV